MAGKPRKAESRPRGRPRSERCRLAVRTAVVELMGELAYDAITVEAIAARAAVSKQTIYRWWSGKHELAMEAYAELMQAQVAVELTGDLETDVRALARRSCRVLAERQRGTTLVDLIVAAQHDDALAKEFRERYVLVRRRTLAQVLDKGIADGKLDKKLNVQVGIDELYGPMWYRLLLRHAPLDDAFADTLADTFLAAHRNLTRR
jgi:AcrR family transcriptional regulator